MKDGQIILESTDPKELKRFSEIVKSESRFAAMCYQRLVDAVAAFNEAGWRGDSPRPPTVAAIRERQTHLERKRNGLVARGPSPSIKEIDSEIPLLWELG
jgi:hypothetical protein